MKLEKPCPHCGSPLFLHVEYDAISCYAVKLPVEELSADRVEQEMVDVASEVDGYYKIYDAWIECDNCGFYQVLEVKDKKFNSLEDMVEFLKELVER